MSRSWSSEFWRLLLYVAGFWLLGLIIGFPYQGIILGFVVFIYTFARRLYKFEKWIHQGLSEPDDFGGVIDDIAFRIYRIRLRSRKRKKKLTNFLREWQNTSGVLPDAAVVLDRDGDIAWFNVTASSMLGLKQSDQGKFIGNLMRNPRFIHYLQQGQYKEHLEIPSPLDPARILSIRITPYGTTRGQRLMLVSDVTHIQRLMTMRRDFIANVSHELRTPLTVIMGYLETLKDDQQCDVDSLKAYIQRIEAPAVRMKTLVEDLLLLSKLDTGMPAALDTSSVINVASMVKNIVTEVEQISQGKHQIEVDIDATLQLKGIEQEIYSAFVNLVSNAVRYTPEGTRIHIQWTELGDGAQFCVRDNGPGIMREHLPRLTERFYRVDVGRSRSTGGTGLGLAIVKQVLRRHDAELRVESEVGKGSEFCCIFPAARLIYQETAGTSGKKAVS
ncbi:MAG: phosphate regulon sensor histidine kinase PhoR [Gammaproteobacteria bacterium]|nr:MAG: phosphate regulon sensor histidine kinase PhoR [Gammaproteobacteria bacterium]